MAKRCIRSVSCSWRQCCRNRRSRRRRALPDPPPSSCPPSPMASSEGSARGARARHIGTTEKATQKRQRTLFMPVGVVGFVSVFHAVRMSTRRSLCTCTLSTNLRPVPVHKTSPPKKESQLQVSCDPQSTARVKLVQCPTVPNWRTLPELRTSS